MMMMIKAVFIALVGITFTGLVFHKKNRKRENKWENILSTIQSTDIEKILFIDLDNTLIAPSEYLGSDEWFYDELDKINSKNSERIAETKSELVEICSVVYRSIQFRTTEKCVKRVLETLRDDPNVKVYGLTARSMVDVTHQNLRDADIAGYFDKTPNYNLHLLGTGTEIAAACISDGIIFCKGNNKGIIVREWVPEECRNLEMFFIDDRLENLMDIQKEFPDKTYIKYSPRKQKCDRRKFLLAEIIRLLIGSRSRGADL